ncbi:MAG: M20/M25/M40 family metallo-hydrolase [Candidatus Caldarchaeum sp.]
MTTYLFERAAKILSDMVRIPSVSGSEKPLCDFIADHVSSLGFTSEKQEVYKTGYNVLVRIGSGNRVLFCGHLDTVPQFDMPEAFQPRLVDGSLFGRGACDMKGGLTSLLLLLEELRKHEQTPDMTFAFVVDEELYGRGAMELMRSGAKADICIITEPTNNKICIGNASCIEFRLRLHGQSGHGAARGGQNAIRNFIQFYGSFEKELEKLLDGSDSKFPMKPIINIGRIDGGYGAWVIPPVIAADILVHMHPMTSYSMAYSKVTDLCNKFGELLNTKIDFIPLHGCDGFILDEQNIYVRWVCEAFKAVHGFDPKLGLIEAETDANALYHKGGLPCIIFGPGDILYAHSSKEHVSVNEVVKNYETLFAFVKRING